MKSLTESQRALELERKLFSSERMFRQVANTAELYWSLFWEIVSLHYKIVFQAQSDKIKMQLRIEELQQKYQPKGFHKGTIVERSRLEDECGDANASVVLTVSLNEEPRPEENEGEVPH